MVKDRRFLCLSEKDRFPQTKILTDHGAFGDVLWGVSLPSVRGGYSPRGIGRQKVTPKGDLSGSSFEYQATAFRFLFTSSQFTTFQKAPT